MVTFGEFFEETKEILGCKTKQEMYKMLSEKTGYVKPNSVRACILNAKDYDVPPGIETLFEVYMAALKLTGEYTLARGCGLRKEMRYKRNHPEHKRFFMRDDFKKGN